MARRTKDTPLTVKEARFVEHYLVDLVATHAAINAGYSVRTARAIAHQLLQKPHIRKAIDAAMKRRSKRVQIQQDDVLRNIYGVLTADPNSLSQFRRHCCRYCWGEGNRFQRTAGEMERDRAAHDASKAKARAEGKPLRGAAAKFDEQGGVGYDRRAMPSPACGECFGDGVGEVFIADTRDLSPEQLALYAGVKSTREGIEVKTHDKVAMATLAMRHLGMLQDKVDHTNKGAAFDGKPAVLNVTIGGEAS
ncbi:terminase small subunit [Alcaligenaceae bacterium C4P045]|nr:terminase small subunit [Alcaligenaceae bacterium C4P045]